MISVAVMGFIMLLVWSTTSQTLDSKERTEKRDLVYQNGRVAIQKIANDLEMSFLMTTPATRAGIAPRPVTFFKGENDGTKDKISFTSFSHMRLFKGTKSSDQCQIGYEVTSSVEEPDKIDLVRKEIPWLDADTEIEAKGFILAENIASFEVEYYDERKDEWVSEWDSEKIDFLNKLPVAVRISISFPDPDDEERTIDFKTSVILPMSKEAIDIQG